MHREPSLRFRFIAATPVDEESAPLSTESVPPPPESSRRSRLTARQDWLAYELEQAGERRRVSAA